MNNVRQRIRNNFIQPLTANDSKRATQLYRLYNNGQFWTRLGRTCAWWDNFVNEVVALEEWRQNLE